MVAQPPASTQTEIIYPDSDGQPIANDTEQFRWILVIQQNIDWLFANDPNVFVAGDLFWYPIEGKNNIVTAPDIMVVFGRPKGKRLSYLQWQEEGIAPQVVFEILSPSNSQAEMEKKLLFYERHGVEEYYIYNPQSPNLKVWLRGEDGLDLIPEIANWQSPRLGIRFDLSGEELQIYRPDGNRFYSYLEICELLEQEKQRANQTQAELEKTKQQAIQTQTELEAAQRKNQILMERLRALGVNPDEL